MLLSEVELKAACRQLHEVIVKNINCGSVIDYLFATSILTDDDLHDLEVIAHKYDKCRRLLMTLHKSQSGRAFIELYSALQRNDTYHWLVDRIDDLCPTQQLSACHDEQIRTNRRAVLTKRLMSEEKILVDSSTQTIVQHRASFDYVKVTIDHFEQLREENEKSKNAKPPVPVRDSSVRPDALRKAVLQVAHLATSKEVNLIHSLPEDKPVFALTTLEGELYVQCEGRDIDVYDTVAYSLQRSVIVPNQGGVHDLTSCRRNRCVYASDWVRNAIHRIQKDNSTLSWPVGDKPAGISVNSSFRLLVTCWESGRVKEFSTDGQLTREIALQADIVHPSHAVELAVDQLLVSHGDVDDAKNRVCAVDSNGRVVRAYGNRAGSAVGQLNGPVRIATNGLVFVADLNNGRVEMLSPTLTHVCTIVHGVRWPYRIWLDEHCGRLYVADNRAEGGKYVSGHVEIYRVHNLGFL